jgi:hypothetical protein
MVAGLFEKKSGHDRGLRGGLMPVTGVLVRLTPHPPDQGYTHPGPY